MSLRALFLLLLFANLAFFGWAALIDVPPEPAQSEGISSLPRLKLLSEVRGKPTSTGPATAPGSKASKSADPPAEGSGASGASGSAASAGSRSTGAAPAGPAPAGTPPASAPPAGTTTGAATASPVSADASRRCITIGPFGDPERAREATDVLRERGFAPRGRTVASRAQGYWVFIGGLRSATDETNVLQRLESNGIADAKAMPTSGTGRRISVGLFNARDGAERRASAVRRLGLKAQVEARPTEEAWVDVDLDSSTQSLPAEGLLSLEEPGSRLEIKECPAPERGTSSGVLTEAGRRPAG